MSVKAETAPYRAAFAPGTGEPAALIGQRDAALSRFEQLGFPTRRDEAWRFTDVRRLQQKTYLPAHPPAARVPLSLQRGEGWGEGAASPPRIADYALAADTHRIVLVNGRLAPELSAIGALPKGAFLAGTAAALHDRAALSDELLDPTDTEGAQAFASLNAALFADGFVLVLEDGVRLERPVEILYWGDAARASFHPRSRIRLGKNSEATVIESFAGMGASWTNAVTAITLADGAALTHIKVQDEDRAAIHFGQARAALGKAAKYESFVLTLGAGLSRHDSFVRYDGEGAEAHLNGAYLLRGEQDATNTTFVDHAVPRCTTHEVFKGVLDDRAHGVFIGKIAVRPDAQKTDAHQLNKNLLLSPRAAVDTKPELEILADDVKCSHGATVGDLDEEALFYLEARGIPAPEARRMLIEAFAADAIDQVENAALRAHLSAHLQRWIGRQDGTT
jgi:Fe-S cluster assembly protein SufD